MSAASGLSTADQISWACGILRDAGASNGDVQDACRVVFNMCSATKTANQNACANAGVVEAVVQVLEGRGSLHDGIAHWGCRALHNMTGNNKSTKARCGGCGAIPAVVRVLRVQTASAMTAKWACAALQNFCANYDPNRAACLRAGAIPAVVTAMQRHVQDGGVGFAIKACGAVGVLCAKSEPNVHECGNRGGVEAVVSFLTRYHDVPEVARWGCFAMQSLATLPANRDRCVAARAVEAVEHALTLANEANQVDAAERATAALALMLKDHPQNVAACCAAGGVAALVQSPRTFFASTKVGVGVFRALRRIAETDPTFQDRCCEGGGVAAALKVLGSQSKNAPVVAAACHALAAMLVNNIKQHRRLRDGAVQCGVTRVMAALQGLGNSVTVVEACVKMLWAAAQSEAVNRSQCGAPKCIRLVLHLLQHCMHDRGVAHAACGFVANVCQKKKVRVAHEVHPNEGNKLLCGSEGAVELVTQALEAHISDPGVAHRACKALHNLAGSNAEHKFKVGECGAIRGVARALERHVRVEKVARWGCAALQNFCANCNPNRVKCGEAGAVRPVVACVETHRNNATVLEKACGAVRMLTLKNDVNRAVCGQIGGVAAVLSAVRALPHDAVVVRWGFGALQSLACDNADNQRTCGEKGCVDEVARGLAFFCDADETGIKFKLLAGNGCLALASFMDGCPRNRQLCEAAKVSDVLWRVKAVFQRDTTVCRKADAALQLLAS